MILNQAARFNFGFASNMVLLLWCICGGLLAHMLEANFLTILLKPVYEKFVDTAEDVLDRGFTVIYPPDFEPVVENNKNSPDYITRTLAERTIVPKVIFSCTESFHLISNFLGRVGLRMMSGPKIKFLIKVLLFMRVASCTRMS